MLSLTLRFSFWNDARRMVTERAESSADNDDGCKPSAPGLPGKILCVTYEQKASYCVY